MALPRDGTLYGGKLLPQNSLIDKWNLWSGDAQEGCCQMLVGEGCTNAPALGRKTRRGDGVANCLTGFRAGFEPFRRLRLPYAFARGEQAFPKIPANVTPRIGSKPARINLKKQPHLGRAEFFALPA